MRAVVYDDVGKVRVDDVPDPGLERDTDAVVGVTIAGICGSDMHFFHGKAPLSPGEPMGHEAVGVVEDVGDAVTGVAPGDRVVVSFTVACGVCWFCTHGRSSLCDEAAIFGTGLFGGALPGTQAERLLVPRADVNLLSIPDAAEDDRALFVADIATTARYVADLADPADGETVAVIGAGPVGLLIVQTLRGRGTTVVALDRDEGRLRAAASWGAQPVHVDERNAQMALASITGDRGADVSIDAVGTPAAFETAVDVVRRGGRVVVAGMYAGETVEVQLGTYWVRGLDVRFAGVCPVHAHWEGAMASISDGSIDPSSLVSHRLPLEDAQRGYELFDRREATKVLLVP